MKKINNNIEPLDEKYILNKIYNSVTLYDFKKWKQALIDLKNTEIIEGEYIENIININNEEG